MKAKQVIGKTLSFVATSLLVAGFVVLFVSAAKVKKLEPCQSLEIHLMGSDQPYVDMDGIQSAILSSHALNPVGKPMSSVRLNQIEKLIRSKPWIAKAYCYMDNHRTLEIRIVQHQPLARVFTRSGTSFYIDTAGDRLPATGRFYTKVPVITGFPDTVKDYSTLDSGLYAQTVRLSRFIVNNSFWMSQIAQININDSREFELVPEVGEQLIEFGNGEQMESKFNNLYSFYRSVLNSKGWNLYDTIDLRYANEVIGTGRHTAGSNSKAALAINISHSVSTDTSNTSSLKRQVNASPGTAEEIHKNKQSSNR